MIQMRVFLAAAVLAASLGGCTTPGISPGRDFQESKASQVTPGMTKAEVTNLLGEPVSTYKNGSQEHWSYYSNATHNNAAAISTGTTVAASAVAMAVPLIGTFAYLGVTAAGLGVMEGAQRTTINTKSLSISFTDGRASNCSMTIFVSDSKASGPRSGTEVTYCGGFSSQNQQVPPGFNPATYAAMTAPR